MTQEFALPPPPSFNSGTGQDVFYRGAPSGLLTQRIPRNTFRVYPVNGPDGKRVPGVVACELVLRTLSGGHGVYQALFEDAPDSVWQSLGVDLTTPGYALMSQRLTVATSPDPTGNLIGVHAENIFGTLIWAIGAGDDVALYKETSATDPTPVAITGAGTAGRPGAAYISASQAVLGGGTTDRRLILGREGTTAIVVGDSAGTIDATMTGVPNNLWWLLQTSLPHASSGGFTILLQAGTSIYAMSTENAPTATPAEVTSNVYGGGFLIKPGEFALGGGPNRAWFVMPKEHTVAGMLRFGSETRGYVYSCNLEGGDLQRLEFNDMPNGILQAAYINSPVHGPSIVATDGLVVALHNGSVEDNLQIFTSQPTGPGISGTINSDWYFRCRGFAVQGPSLFALVERIHRPGTLQTFMSWWKFDWLRRTWTTYSYENGLGAGNSVKSVLAAGNHMVSFNTRFTQTYGGGEWTRLFLLPAGENPFFLYRQTTGSSAGNDFEEVGTIKTPRWAFQQIQGYPSVLEAIACDGDLDAGLATVTLQIDVAKTAAVNDRLSFTDTGVTTTFQSGTIFEDSRWRWRHFKRYPDNTNFFFDFAATIDITQGETPKRTPQLLPIYFYWLTFLNGVQDVRSPRQVRGY